MELINKPWKQIVEFHREIAIRSEESFFSFHMNDGGNERYSFLDGGVVQNLEVSSEIDKENFTNQTVFTNIKQKKSEFYIGGMFWFTNKKTVNGWDKLCHPLFYKPFDVSDDNEREISVSPKQAKWNISPMFYKLLEKKGITTDEDIDDTIYSIIEDAEQKLENDNDDYDKIFRNKLIDRFPDLRKEFLDNIPRGSSTNWLLFSAPKDFSAIQRNLILDYGRLINELDKNPNELGGFELFEKRKRAKNVSIPVSPIVPLNSNQLKVIEKVISGNEIMVVSGPPGCGKSQVVISLMLNAWEKGQSVLFASSNNQAVDVVRARMQQYEKKMPLVVRCGSRKSSELMDTLNDISTTIDTFGEDLLTNISEGRIKKIEQELNKVNSVLESKLPQRVEELTRSAFTAYGKAAEKRTEWREKREEYAKKLEKNNIHVDIDDLEETIYIPFKSWKEKYFTVEKTIKNNENERNLLLKKVEMINSRIYSILEHYYEGNIEKRIIDDSTLGKIKEWHTGYETFLGGFIEDDLGEIPWKYEYEEWDSSYAAGQWIELAQKSESQLASFRAKYSSTLNDIVEKNRKHSATEAILVNNGIKPFGKSKMEALNLWRKEHNLDILEPASVWDVLPFSAKRKRNKYLTQLETQFIDSFPTQVVSEFAANPNGRRIYIAEQHETIAQEYAFREEYEKAMEVVPSLSSEYQRNNDMLTELKFAVYRDMFNLCELDNIQIKLAVKIKIAEEARDAWIKKEKRAGVENKDREYKSKGAQLIYPLMHSLRKDTTIYSFFETVRSNVYDRMDLEALNILRNLVRNNETYEFFNTMDTAVEFWNGIDGIKKQISSIKRDEEYQSEWISECPQILKNTFSHISYDKICEAMEDYEKTVFSILFSWSQTDKQMVDQIKEDGKQELKWAWDNIEKAMDLCGNILADDKKTIINYLQNNTWDPAYIKKMFTNMNNSEFVLKQSMLKAELEEALLNRAIEKRLAELSEDNSTKAAVERLYMDYKRHGETITKEGADCFKTVLNALPLWITTGQSPQSIPMLPGVFDILVIDEATQCTITSILPMIYRCKKIVVIGDMEQLPAIDNISVNAEKFIAEKFKVDEYLYILGHCGCNIYKSVLNMIPTKEGNVISLTDHYRSHPLIIGFSNYYVYKNRLVLRKEMKDVAEDVIKGVFGMDVKGTAHRDSRTDSWFNDNEAREVVKLIESFKNIPEYNRFTIGVITPFRDQVQKIYELLEKSKIDNVLVSTVHKYQGDEKDIIIFSPVVANGISAGAAKWVENPRNLINVAVTRAREALYVIADFNVCKKQSGILRNLIEYVEKIELLRKTSIYELHIFGLMVLQGWEIEIHPVIRDIEVDFVVSHQGKNVVVEVDGEQHKKQKVSDANRDVMLAGRGFDVVRISTREISDMPFQTIEKIKEKFEN